MKLNQMLVIMFMMSMIIGAKGDDKVCDLKGSFKEFDKRAKAGETLDVVYLGGSLTWGANATDPNQTSYRALMGKYLQEKYPKAHIRNHDAAIGGTGSDLGMFRLDRDVLKHDPELVFIDYSVNDGIGQDDLDRAASYELLLRRLIKKGIPVQMVLLGVKGSYLPKNSITKSKRRTQHLKLVKAYNTAVGDTHPYIRKLAKSGKIDLDEVYCFEGTHPDDPGYRMFFEAVRDGYEKAVKDDVVCKLPQKNLFPEKYAWAKRDLLVNHKLPKGWKKDRNFRLSLWFDGLSSRWQDGVAICDVKDKGKIEPLKVKFNGTKVAVFGEGNDVGAHFKAKIDGKPVGKGFDFSTKRFGFTNGRLFKWTVIATDLKPGEHELEITPVFPKGAKKSQLRIESVCSAGK